MVHGRTNQCEVCGRINQCAEQIEAVRTENKVAVYRNSTFGFAFSYILGHMLTHMDYREFANHMGNQYEVCTIVNNLL